MSDVIDHEDTYEAAMERRLSRGMRGKWTMPGIDFPSSHLIEQDYPTFAADGSPMHAQRTRCGRPCVIKVATDEPPATGKTCESCLRWSRRDA